MRCGNPNRLVQITHTWLPTPLHCPPETELALEAAFLGEARKFPRFVVCMRCFSRAVPVARRARRAGFQALEWDDDATTIGLATRLLEISSVEIRLDPVCAVFIAPTCSHEEKLSRKRRWLSGLTWVVIKQEDKRLY